jgi:hypothetical protein
VGCRIISRGYQERKLEIKKDCDNDGNNEGGKQLC